MIATHALVDGTQRGFRATVKAHSKTIASQHFTTKGYRQKDVDETYRRMKKWLAGFGVA